MSFVIMAQRTSLPAVSAEAHADLLARYNTAADPETRTRFQMVVLALDQNLSTDQIAPVVLRSHDTVLRVLQRFVAGGLAAVPRRKVGGSMPTVTPRREGGLPRGIEDAPHGHGVAGA